MKGLSKVLFSGAFIFAGTFLIINNKTTTFSCHRIETESHPCKLTFSGIMGSQTTLIPLEGLQGATVETNSDSDGSTYRVVLMTNEGTIPMTSSSDSRYGSKQELAGKINIFLSNPNERFLLAEEKSWWVLYLIGGVFLLPGIAVAFNLIPDSESED
jgi:hypothetical protein